MAARNNRKTGTENECELLCRTLTPATSTKSSLAECVQPRMSRRIHTLRQLWLPKREGTHFSGEDCRRVCILRKKEKIRAIRSEKSHQWNTIRQWHRWNPRRLRAVTDSDFASLIPPSCRWAPPAIKRGCLGPHSVTATPPADIVSEICVEVLQIARIGIHYGLKGKRITLST